MCSEPELSAGGQSPQTPAGCQARSPARPRPLQTRGRGLEPPVPQRCRASGARPPGCAHQSCLCLQREPRPELRQHRTQSRAGGGAQAPRRLRALRSGAGTPFSGDTRGSCPGTAVPSGGDSGGDRGWRARYSRRAGGRAAPGHGGSAGGAAEPLRL